MSALFNFHSFLTVVLLGDLYMHFREDALSSNP
ncbi:hypothetical protein OIU79_007027 [Salix purpurea]|uniref:Uncharacterized protein n=1 Tax=Salix purpurea TaxID=77065 RepID=A0A9Q0TWT5_SALPP|nr:hypothetical protein OIU79_007027 [Salix purpurea]